MNPPPAYFARRLLLAALFAVLCAPLPVSADASCARYPLNLDNAWLQSITAGPDNSVLAVDPVELRVMKILPLESVEAPIQRVTEAFTGIDGRPSSARFVPTMIQRLDGHFLLGNAGDEILEVTPGSNVLRLKGGLQERNFKVEDALRLLEESQGPKGRLIATFSWSATEDGNVIAFADASYSKDKEKRGFVWFPRSDPSSFNFIREVKVNSEETDLYFIMHPIVAGMGNKGYFLKMERSPALFEYDGESLRRLAFPEHVQQRPSLPPKEGTPTFPDLYGEVETSTTPVSIYPWRGSIWLLGRRPDPAGGTEWTLSRINPGDQDNVSTVQYTLYLPTKAEHVAIAPSEDRWSILEKGSVRALGRQDVRSLLQLPAGWISSPDSPLAEKKSPAFCATH